MNEPDFPGIILRPNARVDAELTGRMCRSRLWRRAQQNSLASYLYSANQSGPVPEHTADVGWAMWLDGWEQRRICVSGNLHDDEDMWNWRLIGYTPEAAAYPRGGFMVDAWNASESDFAIDQAVGWFVSWYEEFYRCWPDRLEQWPHAGIKWFNVLRHRVLVPEGAYAVMQP